MKRITDEEQLKEEITLLIQYSQEPCRECKYHTVNPNYIDKSKNCQFRRIDVFADCQRDKDYTDQILTLVSQHFAGKLAEKDKEIVQVQDIADDYLLQLKEVKAEVKQLKARNTEAVSGEYRVV